MARVAGAVDVDSMGCVGGAYYLDGTGCGGEDWAYVRVSLEVPEELDLY